MRAFVTILALIAALLGSTSEQKKSPAQTGGMGADHSSAASGLQILLDEAVSNGIPGISAAVATRDGVVWTGAAGKADLQTGAPVRSDMLFGMGSITKTFVAVVILQLADEGRLDLKTTAENLLGPAVEDIPNARVEVIDAGHLMGGEQPEQINALITDFFEGE